MTDGVSSHSLRPIGEYIQMEIPTAKMLERWQSLCAEKIGQDVQVMLADRKDNPDIAELPGDLNLAHPYILGDGSIALIVWLNSVAVIDQVVITHEVGHWVLLLQGFCGFNNKNAEVNKMKGSFLNALLQHAPLYEFQKQIGHNPQPVINSYSESYILSFSQYKETAQNVIEHALIAADIMINALEIDRNKLGRVLKKRHRNTNKLVRTIMNLQGNYNTLKPNSNKKWGWEIIKVLGLGAGWSEVSGEDIITRLIKAR